MTKIVIIEDESDIRQDMVEALMYEGFDVSGASDGEIGLQIIRETLPDLIISDIMMPKLDGYSVLEALRENIETAGIPIIFVTAKTSREEVRRGMELGVDDYLTKPFTTDELLSAVHTRLKRKEKLFEISEQKFADVKKQFAYTVAHELRTPITGMALAQELLTQQGENFSPQELREIIGTMSSSNRRMTHLVEQVTYFVQLDTGLLNQESIVTRGQPVPFWTIMVGIVDQARRFTSRNQDIPVNLKEGDKDLMVIGNMQALKHAICEVISNALKFSKPDGTVNITYNRKNDHVLIHVDDRGIGMARDEISNALQPFEQINREQNEQQGSGLGLWLAFKIVEVHGGELKILSVEGKGTRVAIRLPLG